MQQKGDTAAGFSKTEIPGGTLFRKNKFSVPVLVRPALNQSKAD